MVTSPTGLGPENGCAGEALSPGVKRARRESDHSTSAEVKKNMDLYTHSPHTPSWRTLTIPLAKIIFHNVAVQRYVNIFE
jgi:hypothetical protein